MHILNNLQLLRVSTAVSTMQGTVHILLLECSLETEPDGKTASR